VQAPWVIEVFNHDQKDPPLKRLDRVVSDTTFLVVR
jgi:hypothetical protein